MTTELPSWNAIVETRDDRFIVLVTRNGEPAGSIILEPEDSKEIALAAAGAILSLNQLVRVSELEERPFGSRRATDHSPGTPERGDRRGSER